MLDEGHEKIISKSNAVKDKIHRNIIPKISSISDFFAQSRYIVSIFRYHLFILIVIFSNEWRGKQSTIIILTFSTRFLKEGRLKWHSRTLNFLFRPSGEKKWFLKREEKSNELYHIKLTQWLRYWEIKNRLQIRSLCCTIYKSEHVLCNYH